jgi:hypothetical protein
MIFVCNVMKVTPPMPYPRHANGAGVLTQVQRLLRRPRSGGRRRSSARLRPARRRGDGGAAVHGGARRGC